MKRRLLPVLLLAMLVGLLAGCGGGGGSSSDPNSENYDPAETTLKEAGLEVCGEAESQSSHGLDEGDGVVAARGFFVAADCMGSETSPNQIIVFQFNGRESLDAGVPKVKAAYPRAAVAATGPLVIVARGPDAAANLAAVQKALAGGGSG